MIDFLAGVLVGGAGTGLAVVAHALIRSRSGDGRHRLVSARELRNMEIQAGLRPPEFLRKDGRRFTRDPETGATTEVRD